MSNGVVTILAFVVIGIIYLTVSYIGNKIVDKGEDAIRNAGKRKRNASNNEETENLAERYRR